MEIKLLSGIAFKTIQNMNKNYDTCEKLRKRINCTITSMLVTKHKLIKSGIIEHFDMIINGKLNKRVKPIRLTKKGEKVKKLIIELKELI